MTQQFFMAAWPADMVLRESGILNMINRDDRRGHLEPPSKEELADYRRWKRQWKKLDKEGWKRGWLNPGFEDESPYPEQPRGTWVYDETEDEYQARLDAAGIANARPGQNRHVTFPVVKR